MRALQLALVAIGYTAMATASDAQLSYGGWTADTSLQAMTQRYPHSRATDTYIDVADSDSHDLVHYISVGNELILLGFAHRSSQGREVFPLCDEILGRIRANYGDPDIVENFNEEAMVVYRPVWKRGTEHLAVRCFEMGNNRYAERIELYRFDDRAT
jgi:hypothetical protein